MILRWSGLAAFVVLAVLSLLRHWTFHANVFDLGIFEQVLWNLAHGGGFDSSVKGMSYLGDHFSPALALLAPLQWLPRPVETLLVAQAAAEVATAFAVGALARRQLGDERLGSWIGVLTLVHPALFTPVLGDVHPEPFMAAALAWGLLELDRGRVGRAAILMLVTLAGKEDAGLLLCPLGIVLALGGRRRFGVALAVAAAAWTVVVVAWVMPMFRPPDALESQYLARYGPPGTTTLGGLVGALFAHPVRALAAAFQPFKLRTLVLLLAPLAFAPLLAPRRALVALPTTLFHYLSRFRNEFIIQHQYFVPTAAVLGWAAIGGARPIFGRFPRAAPAFALVVALVWSVGPIVREADEFLPSPRSSALAAAVALVPDDADACGPMSAGAHLARRRHFDLCVEVRRGVLRTSTARYQLFAPDAPAATMRLVELRARGAAVLFERDGVTLLVSGAAPPGG